MKITVSNIAGRPMRTRLRLVPQEPARPEWFAVQGGEERVLGLGATETFAVSVTVPPEVPAGSYTFRADAVGEDSPDEDFQTGPTVSLAVPAAAAKASFPWWIVAVAAAVIVLGVGAFVLIKNSGGDPEPAVRTDDPVATVTIPQVKGTTQSAAVAALESLGLVVDIAVIDSVAPVTTCDPKVLITVPAAAAVADVGSTITVAVPPINPATLCLFRPKLLFTDLFTFKFST